MWFDAHAALAAIEAIAEIWNGTPPPAIPAISAIRGALGSEKGGEIAGIATIAPPKTDIQKSHSKRLSGASLVMAAIDLGNVEGCKWQSRHGAIATEIGLGGTVTYQLIDRLIEQGRVLQARDGVLSVVRAGE